MKAPRHHAHGETLISYAAGALDPALSMVLKCHLQFCEKCRAEVRSLEVAGGIFLETLNAPADEDFFRRTMERFAKEDARIKGSVLPLPSPDPGTEVLMPEPLASASGLRREAIPWKKLPHGASRFDLPKLAGSAASSRLMHLEPGAILHAERHGGQLALVLWGAYEYDGQLFERGDLHDLYENGFKTFKGASPEGVTFFTAMSPVPQPAIFRTGH